MEKTDELLVGKLYDVVHVRKGNFRIEVESQDDTWVTGFLIAGKPVLISSIMSNTVSKGERITIRRTLSTFTLVEEQITPE